LSCAAGYYAAAAAVACTGCAAGLFQSNSVAAACASCLSGAYSAAAAACINCAAGNYAGAPQLPAGQYSAA